MLLRPPLLLLRQAPLVAGLPRRLSTAARSALLLRRAAPRAPRLLELRPLGWATAPAACPGPACRAFSSGGQARRTYAQELGEKNQRVSMYMVSVALMTLGLAYASVPLYKVFCQATGFGGETKIADAEKVRKMSPVTDARQITVTFNADTADSMPWKFRPLQRSVKVLPGETSLAFYRAHNISERPVTGVSTYNVVPMKAGVYFNKIQCFCFDEQRLRAGEEVDMPLFFFIDPEFLDDPQMHGIENIVLSYTFFKTNVQEDEDAEDAVRVPTK